MSDAAAPPPPTGPLTAAERRALGRMAGQLALTFAAILGVAAAAGAWLRGPLVAAGEAFVGQAGAPGVGVAFLLLDIVPMPIPPDLFSVAALLGGVPFWLVVAWATLGAMAGSACAWGVGRLLGRTAWFRNTARGADARVAAWMRRWGDLGLVLVIVSPIPFEVGAWTCAALGMPLWRLLAWASLRGVRIAAYLALFRLGWVEAG